jgi:hypothetical protein
MGGCDVWRLGMRGQRKDYVNSKKSKNSIKKSKNSIKKTKNSDLGQNPFV